MPVTHSECIIVVHEDVDNSSDHTGGVEIGQLGKLCFKEGYSTNTHVQARAESSFWLKQGIYIRPDTSGTRIRKRFTPPLSAR